MIQTAVIANKLRVKSESIRARLASHGSYYGLQPVKLPNGHLRWPDDSVERLVDAATTKGDAPGAPLSMPAAA